MLEHRLGDDIDDYCIKCKRLTNHAIVSLVGEQPAKVRCRSCYNDHDFRRCEIPPTKKELKRLQLMNEALALGGVPMPEPVDEEISEEELPEEESKPAGAAKRRASRP